MGLALMLAAMGCGSKAPDVAAAPKTVADYFPIKVGDRTVRMQLAVLPQEQERGLMERTDLAPDVGMIFIYRSTQRMSFWMHDTPTPLDIGFFTADGTLVEVYPMLPYDEKTIASRSQDLKFALEMNLNWYRDNGVKPGAKLDLKALTAAVKARDFLPRKLGMEE
jgi:hypothetical protein